MADEPAQIEKTKLTVSMGASVAVTTGTDYQDWIKPSVSFSLNFNGIPSEEQVRDSTTFIQTQILAPVLEDIIVLSQQKLEEARRKR